MVDLVTSLNQAAENFDKLSLQFESDEPIVSQGQPFFPLVLEASGSTKTLLMFWQMLSQTPFLIKITSLEAKSTDAFVSQATMVIRGNLYVSPSF